MDYFNANPYNPSNKLITSDEIVKLMSSLDIHDFTIRKLHLYQMAFTHKSYCKIKEYDTYVNECNALPLQDKSYETIEFLGDAILESVVCSYLYNRFHEIHGQNEGFLTKLKIRLVCGSNLCDLSRKLKFQGHIILSKQTENHYQSGRENDNILEDIFESLIGAIYLDNSYEVAEKFIIHVIEKHVDFTDILLTDTNFKDQISRYIKRTFDKYPEYKINKSDDKYYCSILLDGDTISTGMGGSKKKSEQDASKRALIKYNVITK